MASIDPEHPIAGLVGPGGPRHRRPGPPIRRL